MRGVFVMMVIAGAASLGGCTPRTSDGGFDSDDPGAQLYAIRRAGNAGDRNAIPHLIQALDSDDIAVRLYAINALERIAGTRLGYVYYAPQNERTESIDRWSQAYESGELAPTRAADANVEVP